MSTTTVDNLDSRPMFPTFDPLAATRRPVAIGLMALATSIGALMATASDAAATAWTVVPGESRIQFSGTHAGRAFKGTFEKWTAAIVFDPANLAASKATVTVDLASAKTGDTTYDKTLPSIDWFDIAKTPSGVYTTTAFRSVGADAYEADGTLAIRGLAVPVTLAFQWKTAGDRATLTGRTKVKRLDFGIGKSSDAPGEWVALDIPVEVAVTLTKG
ncbi:MAG: YceI family protein [Rhodospirillales bacterium]|nr:YceI family protein [Rhodospirillales bacterium]